MPANECFDYYNRPKPAPLNNAIRLRLIVPPQPAQRIRQYRPSVPVAVKAVPPLEFVIVTGKRERLRHLLIRERPVTVRVIQIVRAVLQKHADRFRRLRLADERRVVVAAFAQRRAVGDVREAADPREYFAEFVRALPRDGEGADAAAADARNRAARRVVAQLYGLLHFRQNLFE